MKNEMKIEQMKKSYTAPQMEVVEYHHEASLLEGSPCLPGQEHCSNFQ